VSDESDTRTPESDAATSPPSPQTEPAFLARARRILGGDIRPDDYLPVTPEVQACVDRDLAFIRDHIRRQYEAGRIPAVYELDPSTPIQQRNEWLLSFHHGRQNIACIVNDTGVIVLAVGLDQTGALLDAFPYEMRKDVGLDTPEPFDW
jgi:hypothetical protein